MLYLQLATLPSTIAYSTTLVVSPLKERTALIPRRALFDVRMQIMAESNSSSDSTPASPTVSTSSKASSSPSPKVYLTNGLKKKKRKDLNGNRLVQDSEGSEIGLGDVDIEQNVYEGGFKSWEGALDLARLVLERGPRKDIDELSRVQSVVEVSQAHPSHHLLTRPLTSSN